MNSVVDLHLVSVLILLDCEYVSKFFYFFIFLWLAEAFSLKPLTNLSHLFKVFPCVSATCGHFYHPKCVSKLLHPSDVTKAEELCSKIAEGDSFTCPVHKCFECKQVEDKKVYELQFAICRRCPKAYHRKCLPRFPNLIFLFEVSINAVCEFAQKTSVSDNGNFFFMQIFLSGL